MRRHGLLHDESEGEYPMGKKCYLFLLVSLVVMIASCGSNNPYLMKEATFKPPFVMLDEKPLVYVYREDVEQLKSYIVHVGNGNEIVGSLKAGSFCSFKASSGRDHLITVTMANMPLNGIFIYPAGESPTHLLFTFRNKKAYLTKISPEKGAQLQQQLAYTVIEKKNQNNPVFEQWYEQVLFNPEMMADMQLMRPTDRRLEPDAAHAVITFIRASRVFHNLKAAVWSETELLGCLGGGHAFQIKVPAGKHVFIGKMEHFAFLEANVEAGKTYVVNVPVTMGWKAPHVRLIPVGGKVKEEDRRKWIDAADTLLALDTDMVCELMRKHHKEATDRIEDAMIQMHAGKLDKRVLERSDGR